MMPSRDSIKYDVDSVIRAISRTDFKVPDGRFRQGTTKGQIQDIIFDALEIGIKLKKSHIIKTWFDLYGPTYGLEKARRERRQLMRTQINLAHRIKKLNELIGERK